MEDFLPHCTEKAPELQIKGTSAEKERLKKIATIVSQSSAGKEILDACQEQKVKLRFMKTNFPGEGGFYHSVFNAMYLDPRVPDSKLIEYLSHEGRHVRQNGLAGVEFGKMCTLSPKNQILRARYKEADAYAVAGLVKAQLKQKGAHIPVTVRDRMDNLGGYLVDDLYEKIARTQKTALKDGRAVKTAFAAWVLEERSTASYETKYADNVADYIAISDRKDDLKTPFNKEEIASFCSVNGQNYLEAGAEKLDLENPLYAGVSEENVSFIDAAMTAHNGVKKNRLENDLTPEEKPAGDLPNHLFFKLTKKEAVQSDSGDKISSETYQAMAQEGVYFCF